jgi:exosortase J
MFAPNFGMFIAPGCDGMRGSVTLGYAALIIGYLKRLSVPRWSLYVAGAVLLGHLFNLVRLCALVLYYRVASGHAFFEKAAKQADYVIGGALFLLAASLFLWIMFRKDGEAEANGASADRSEACRAGDWRRSQWKAAVLAPLVLFAMVSAVRALRIGSESLALSVRRGEISTTELNARIPTQVGEYRLVRAWQEQQAGTLVLETAAFERAPSGEIELGIWLGPSEHSIQQSLITHGEMPKTRAVSQFSTAGGRTVQFNTALYDDGVSDTLTGDTYCSPFSCQPSLYKPKEGVHLAITKAVEQTERGKRIIPIFFKMQAPYGGSQSETAYKELSIECEEFLSHLDLTQLSRNFQ